MIIKSGLRFIVSAMSFAAWMMGSCTHVSAHCFLPPSPCEWYASHHGQPTFVGTVLRKESVSDVVRVGEHAIGRTVDKVSFRVEERFEGISEPIVDVYGFGTVNDFHFEVGGKYLVYAVRGKDGKLRTEKCTRTAAINEAAEDMQFLRSLPTRTAGKILGIVRSVGSAESSGKVAGSITESNAGHVYKKRVTSSGIYELDGLPPGEYRETFTPDGENTEFFSAKVTVPVIGSCASSGVRLGNLTVSGRVVDLSGKSKVGENVYLFYALDDRFQHEVGLKVRSDRDGRFKFHRVEPAKFILVVESKKGQVFFPGTRDIEKAQVLDVDESRRMTDLKVTVP